MPSLMITEQRHSVFGFYVCQRVHNTIIKVCEHYLTNRFWEFHHICNLGAVGDKDEMIRFWGRMFKVIEAFWEFWRS